MYLFEAAEQMTDELLERVQCEMDIRHWTETINRKFHFLRFRLDSRLYSTEEMSKLVHLRNRQDQQSLQQNLHPGIVYCEFDRDSEDMKEMDLIWHRDFFHS
jgi:hypothetical protein